MSTAVNQRKTRCEATARCAPPRHHGIASRLSPCRRGRQTPTKLTPDGTDEGSLSTCCSTRRLAHGSQPRTRTCTRTHARIRAQPPARACLCVSDDLTRSASCSPHTHVFGRSRPTPANRHLPPTGTDRRPSTTSAARAVAPARTRQSSRPPNRLSPSLDVTGTVRISRWRYVAYLRPQLANGYR